MSEYKNALLKMFEISQTILKNGLDGSRLPANSSENNKYHTLIKTKIDNFKNEFGKGSPQKYLESQLKSIIDKRDDAINYETQSFPYFGRVLRSYCWTAITSKDPNIKSLKVRYYPQLYILVNDSEVHFGFCYGFNVKPNFVEKVKENSNIMDQILELIEKEKNLKLYPEIDASALDPKTVENISSAWSNKINLIERYSEDSIPDNIDDRIKNLIDSLFPLFDLISTNRKIEKTKKHQKTPLSKINCLIANKKQIILYGPPGTGKTFNAQKVAVDYIIQNLSNKKNSVKFSDFNMPLKKSDEELRNEILKMLKDASWVDRKSSKLLAKKYGVSTQTVAGLKARINKTIIQGKSWSG